MIGAENKHVKGQQKAVLVRLEKAKAEMIGKRFGQLVVKEYIRSASRGFVWLCECSCAARKETQTEASSAALIDGTKQSCGCGVVSQRLGKAKAALTGKKFGRPYGSSPSRIGKGRPHLGVPGFMPRRRQDTGYQL